MIYAKEIRQYLSGRSTGEDLKKWLRVIQCNWNCKVISVYQVDVVTTSEYSNKGFVIIYDDQKENKTCEHIDGGEVKSLE